MSGNLVIVNVLQLEFYPEISIHGLLHGMARQVRVTPSSLVQGFWLGKF